MHSKIISKQNDCEKTLPERYLETVESMNTIYTEYFLNNGERVRNTRTLWKQINRIPFYICYLNNSRGIEEAEATEIVVNHLKDMMVLYNSKILKPIIRLVEPGYYIKSGQKFIRPVFTGKVVKSEKCTPELMTPLMIEDLKEQLKWIDRVLKVALEISGGTPSERRMINRQLEAISKKLFDECKDMPNRTVEKFNIQGLLEIKRSYNAGFEICTQHVEISSQKLNNVSDFSEI